MQSGLQKSLAICSPTLKSLTWEARKLKRKEKNKTICNYASGKWTSRKQLVNIILHKTNSRGTAEYIPFLEVTPGAFIGD